MQGTAWAEVCGRSAAGAGKEESDQVAEGQGATPTRRSLKSRAARHHRIVRMRETMRGVVVQDGPCTPSWRCPVPAGAARAHPGRELRPGLAGRATTASAVTMPCPARPFPFSFTLIVPSSFTFQGLMKTSSLRENSSCRSPSKCGTRKP